MAANDDSCCMCLKSVVLELDRDWKYGKRVECVECVEAEADVD